MVAIDWIHHLISGGIVGTLCTFYIRGSVVGHGLFFMCGLPGGIDYLMLTLNDFGYLSRLTEKRINRLLNMYIRMPGILFNCYTGYINYLYNPDFEYSLVSTGTVFLIDLWNGLYFAQRVTENYGYTVGKSTIEGELDEKSNMLEI